MGLRVSKTVLAHTADGVIKIAPQGGRKVIVTAAPHVRLTDKHGKPLTKRRPSR